MMNAGRRDKGQAGGELLPQRRFAGSRHHSLTAPAPAGPKVRRPRGPYWRAGRQWSSGRRLSPIAAPFFFYDPAAHMGRSGQTEMVKPRKASRRAAEAKVAENARRPEEAKAAADRHRPAEAKVTTPVTAEKRKPPKKRVAPKLPEDERRAAEAEAAVSNKNSPAAPWPWHAGTPPVRSPDRTPAIAPTTSHIAGPASIDRMKMRQRADVWPAGATARRFRLPTGRRQCRTGHLRSASRLFGGQRCHPRPIAQTDGSASCPDLRPSKPAVEFNACRAAFRDGFSLRA